MAKNSKINLNIKFKYAKLIGDRINKELLRLDFKDPFLLIMGTYYKKSCTFYNISLLNFILHSKFFEILKIHFE